MNVQKDYIDVKSLGTHAGYQILESEMMQQVSEIEAKRSKAAKSGQESAWRYWAGLEEGFKMAMLTRTRVLGNMEKQMEEDHKTIAEKLLEEVRTK